MGWWFKKDKPEEQQAPEPAKNIEWRKLSNSMIEQTVSALDGTVELKRVFDFATRVMWTEDKNGGEPKSGFLIDAESGTLLEAWNQMSKLPISTKQPYAGYYRRRYQ